MSMFDTQHNTDHPAARDSKDALLDLHTISVDTLSGLQKMAEKAEPEFRPVMERYCALHARHVARLDTMAREMGGVPDAEGSFMGSINRAVVTLRAAFDTIDAGVMHNVHSGEEKVLAAFDDAIQASLPQGHQQALTEMRAELSTIIDDTRRLT